MATTASRQSPSRAGTAVAAASLLTTLVTGLACTGPLLAIVLGVSGLGFLTRYAHLQAPATVATAALLGLGFVLLYRRRACPTEPRRWPRVLLWTATALAVAMNVFEYVILPRL